MIKKRAIIIECGVNHFYNLVYFDELNEINKIVHLETSYESMKKIKDTYSSPVGFNYFYKVHKEQIKKDL